MSQPVIDVRNLVKTFTLGGQVVRAVDDVSFVIEPGEIVSIVGPSGSGKSTLLGLIGGLDVPTAGDIFIDGINISRMNERQLTNLRNEKIGFVFQFFNLITTLTALENVALPIQFSLKKQFDPSKRAKVLLQGLELGDRLDHRPNQLSGGQQQRVAIARALANNPPLLLADEPTGNLNTEAGELVIDTLRQVRQEFGTTVVIVTHDLHVARQADRILNLVDGRIVEEEKVPA
jgi:putative ABC transport system ATP-binding protein